MAVTEPTLTAAALQAAVGCDTATAARLLPVAVALVKKYAASDAPVEITNEACIRCAGYLYEQPAASARQIVDGDITAAFSPAATGALRASGAMSLLSNWKERGAGVI